MDENLAVDCIEVVENLSQKEKNKILSVLKRDDKLRLGQEQKISQLKYEIKTIKMMGILRAGDDQTKMCIRCRAQFGFIFNRGDICPACRFKVCNLCQEVMFNKSWLCRLCYKQRQLKWLTGEWAAFEQNPLRKWASGSDIYTPSSTSLQLFTGATSIDIGEPDRSSSNNNRSSKSAHNGVLNSPDQEKQRVEYPKEADQHKLSQLFGVLRSRKPEETAKELQVRRISTRKYSETDSDSSSSSDVEAPSVTESELDKTESPRRVESPKSRLEAVDEALNETVESDRVVKQTVVQKSKQKSIESNQQEIVSNVAHGRDRVVRPKVAHPSNRPKTYKTEVEASDTQPRKRERKKIMPDQTVARELRIQASEVSKVSQSKSVDVNLSDPGVSKELGGKRKVLSHTELHTNKLGDPYASRSHESLDKNSESHSDRAFAMKNDAQSPRRPIPANRHSTENLGPQNKNNVYHDTRRSHESLDSSRDKGGSNQNIRQARSHEHLPSRARQTDQQAHLQGSVESIERESIAKQKELNKAGIDIEVTGVSDNIGDYHQEFHPDIVEVDHEIKGQRAGSPYSFSMDSLPSSNPSPTLRRSIDSSIPEFSDTDSVSKLSHHEGGEFSGTESQVKEGSSDDFDVEEISKVRFQRVSRKAGNMLPLTKISNSPKRPGSYEGVDREQRKSQSRGGSGGKDTADINDSEKSQFVISEIEPIFEEPIQCVKTQKAKAISVKSGKVDNEIKEEGYNDQKLIVNRGKTVLTRLNITSNNLSESEGARFSTGSEPRSAAELSWFDEYSMDNRKSVSKTPDIQVFVDDKDVKDNAESDTDSVEGLIDTMARPHLQVEIMKRAPRGSEADSEASFHMTPISPLPPDTFETRAGTYTLTYMESDDNLDALSTDDNLDAESDDESAPDEEIVEKRVVTGRAEKQKLKATNSLDLLIEKQKHLFGSDQDLADIDSEFNEALKIASSADSIPDITEQIMTVKTETNLSKEDGSFLYKSKQQKDETCTDVADGPIKTKQPDVQLRMIPGRAEVVSKKAKLAPQKSLDLLISNQGELIDPHIQKVELESELQAALEQHLKESKLASLNFEDIVLDSEREVEFLGMQLNIGKGSDEEDKREGTSPGSPLPVINRHVALKQNIESESEDSDILSVIEEEEELSESSEQLEDNKIKSKSSAAELENVPSKSSSKQVGSPVDTEIRNITNSEKKLKLSDKIKAMEDNLKEIKGNSKSFEYSGHDKYEGYDMKIQSKFKKLQERWNAIEKHEADLLDIDEGSDNIQNNIQNESDRKTQTSMPILISDESNLHLDDKTEQIDSTSEAVSSNINNSDIELEITKSYSDKTNKSMDIDWSKVETRSKRGRTDPDSKAEIIVNVEVSNLKENVRNYSTNSKDNDLSADLFQKDKICETEINKNIIEKKRQDKQLPNMISDKQEGKSLNTEEISIGTKESPHRKSINDKVSACHSLADLNLIENVEENVSTDEASTNNYEIDNSGQDIRTPESLARCQSSGDDLNIPPSNSIVHETVAKCYSIADDDEYYVPDDYDRCVSIGENVHMEYDEKLPENVFIEESEIVSSDVSISRTDKSSSEEHEMDEKETSHRPLVRLSKLRVGMKLSDPAMKTESADLERAGTYIIKTRLSDPTGATTNINGSYKTDSLSSSQENKGLTDFTTIDSKSGHEIHFELINKKKEDSVFPHEPQGFKVPTAPLQLESKVSSSSVPNSPDLSVDIPFALMDSSKSDKLTSHRTSPQTISESSTSQDDSGLASGGSRGATPEHKRTDSGYSQSSLPSSTLSTVTDRSSEEEDIDRVLAKMKSSGGRGNLLSVVADSRESIASFYSDAGDIAYSNIPVTGEILFGLNYNYKVGMLEVQVKQCRDIAAVDTKRRRSDPYVKTYLLPDKTRSGKRKTKVKKHALNPTFDEVLKYSISKSELENRTLWVTVWHNDRFGRNDFLGEVTINFDYFKFDDPSPKWYPLQERLDTQPTSLLTYKGDIVLSVRYVPADKVKVSEFKGKPKRDAGKGQLHVVVKEARNLTAVRSNGFSDPFCKGYLLPERHRSSKQKTAVIKKNCNPGWNHTFIFEDVSVLELQERCLELTIWDYEKLSSNDFLGGVRLNLGTGTSQGKPVDWMDARGEEMTMWQAMLDRPNLWIDGTLILRPNMEKRKF